MRGDLIAFYTLTETLPLRVHLAIAHSRRFRRARVFVAARVRVVEWSTTHQRVGKADFCGTESRATLLAVLWGVTPAYL